MNPGTVRLAQLSQRMHADKVMLSEKHPLRAETAAARHAISSYPLTPT